MKKFACVLAAALIAPAVFAADMTEEQKTFYAVGAMLGMQAKTLDPAPADAEAIKKGFADTVSGGKSAVELETYGPKIQQLAQARRAVALEKAGAAGKEFAEKAAKETGAVKSASGLVYLSLKDGTGASPAETDIVKVNYVGKLVDGKEFDSSYKRGEPAEFPLNGVIKCWTEGVQKMKVGGKAKLVCPPAIAYGARGAGNVIPPNATLNFEIELLSVKGR